jgi:hypothetical protein
MPVILHPDTWDAWLTARDPGPAVLPQPYPADQMTMYPVSKRVGNVENDDPKLMTDGIEKAPPNRRGEFTASGPGMGIPGCGWVHRAAP